MPYNNPNGVMVHGNTMYISGTHTARDVADDTLIPLHIVHNSERYQQAQAAMSHHVHTVVGHSLGGAVAARLTEQLPHLHARVYGVPLARLTANPRVQSFRHAFDPVSMLDRSAVIKPANGWNPHSYGGFH